MFKRSRQTLRGLLPHMGESYCQHEKQGKNSVYYAYFFSFEVSYAVHNEISYFYFAGLHHQSCVDTGIVIQTECQCISRKSKEKTIPQKIGKFHCKPR